MVETGWGREGEGWLEWEGGEGGRTLFSFTIFLPQILDFGLARATDNEMTGYVATRYWRAPEIMLNWMHYNNQGLSHYLTRFSISLTVN